MISLDHHVVMGKETYRLIGKFPPYLEFDYHRADSKDVNAPTK